MDIDPSNKIDINITIVLLSLFALLVLVSYQDQNNKPDRFALQPVDTTKVNYTSSRYHDVTGQTFSPSEYFRDKLEAILHLTMSSFLILHHYRDKVDINQFNGPQVNQKQCTSQLTYLHRKVLKGSQSKMSSSEDYSILGIMDSYGKPGSGMLKGNVFFLGDYDQCLGSRLHIRTNSSYEIVKMKYCVSKLKAPNWRAAHINQTDPRFTLSAYDLNSMANLEIGICLPEACDTSSYKLNQKIIDQLIRYNLNQAISDFNIETIYCLPDEDSPSRKWWLNDTSASLLVITIASWVALILIASVLTKLQATFTKNHGQKHLELDLMEQLSVQYNLERLFKMNKINHLHATPRLISDATDVIKVDFSFSAGLKVLPMWYIVAGHFFMYTSGRAKNIFWSDPLVVTTLAPWNMIPALWVNLFFVITGVFTSYNIFKNDIEKLLRKPVLWIYIFLQRYLKMVPMWALTFWFTKSLLKYTGSGPLWDYATSGRSFLYQCEQESWTSVFLLLANGQSPSKHCITPAWYLACDFQFLLLTPILLWFIQRHRKLAYNSTIFYISFMTFSYVLAVCNTSYDLRPLNQFSFLAFRMSMDTFWRVYTLPHYRIQPYLLGLVAGHVLHRYENNKLKNHWLIDESRTIYVIIIASIQATAVFVIPYIPLNNYTDRVLPAFILSTAIPTSSLMSTFLVTRLAIGRMQMMNRLLLWKLWRPLSTTNLTTLIIHCPVIIYILNSRRELTTYEFKYFIAELLAELIVVQTLSIILCILFQMPLNNLFDRLTTINTVRNRDDRLNNGEQNNGRSSVDQAKALGDSDTKDK